MTIEEYWSWCVADAGKCLRLAECRVAGKCMNRIGQAGLSCQAYDYCPKREGCLAAARCLDARAGPPRRVGARPSVSDPVNHPRHYTSHPSGVECIQITRWLNFNRGNAIKYIWRAEEHGAKKEIEDLKKARWYIDDEIKRLEAPSGKTED